MAENAESAGRLLLPANGYDATLCPYCLGKGRATMTNRRTADGWTLRRRTCPKCRQAWATVELYVSDKRNGKPRKGTAHRRMMALEVDALDMDALGPDTETKEGAHGHPEV